MANNYECIKNILMIFLNCLAVLQDLFHQTFRQCSCLLLNEISLYVVLNNIWENKTHTHTNTSKAIHFEGIRVLNGEFLCASCFTAPCTLVAKTITTKKIKKKINKK